MRARSPHAESQHLLSTRGAGWLTLGDIFASGANYALALVLLHLLPPDQYAVYGGLSSLMLVVGAAASSALPWLVSRELATQGGSYSHLGEMTGFVIAATLVEVAMGGILVAAVGWQIGGSAGAMVASVAAASLFAGASASGWLQGQRRFGALAVLRVAEAAIRLLVTISIVYVGGGADLAILGFLTGGTLMFIGSVSMATLSRPLLRGAADRRLWRLAAGLLGVQAAVTALGTVDVIVIAAFAIDAQQAAAYQAAALFGRAPMFVATALAIAAFPSISAAGPTLRLPADVRRWLTTFVWVVGPVAILIGTAPPSLIGQVTPEGYAVGRYLPWLACSGFFSALVLFITMIGRALGVFKPIVIVLMSGLSLQVLLTWSALQTGGAGTAAAMNALAMALVAFVVYPWALPPLPEKRSLIEAVGILALLLILLSLLRAIPVVWVAAAAVVATLVAWKGLFRRET